MTRHQPILILLALFSVFLLLWACSDHPTDTFSSTALVNSLESDKNFLDTNRATTLPEAASTSFNLIYEGDLETLLVEEGALDQLLEEYDLNIKASFEVDEVYQGITLQAAFPLDDDVQVGKILSVVEQVVMVEVKNRPDNVEDYL